MGIDITRAGSRGLPPCVGPPLRGTASERHPRKQAQFRLIGRYTA